MAGKKKILFVVEKLYGGGVENIARIILRNFDYHNYELSLLTVPYQELSDDITSLPITYQYVFGSYKSGDSFIKKLWTKCLNKIKLFIYYKCPASWFSNLFVRGDYDIAIAFIEGYATRIVAGKKGISNRLAWIHIDLDAHHWTDVAFRSRKEERLLYKHFKKICCVSNRVKDVSCSLFDINDRALTVYNPIESDNILTKSLAQHSNFWHSESTIKFISLGTLVPRKGYDKLILAVINLIRHGYNVELLVLGEGSERDKLEALINTNNMQTYIHLPGFVENPYPYLKEANVYVCSSDAEGYNTAITEALILGKAVVSTDCCGVREQLGNNEYGIIVEDNCDALYCGLVKMLDATTRERFSRAAKSSSKRFNLNDNMNIIYSLIEE